MTILRATFHKQKEAYKMHRGWIKLKSLTPLKEQSNSTHEPY